ncbi:RNA polymerase subunit sigma-24 [Cellulomonas sp. DKR-3]|uniref:RNA polymerase subunit sigma-24 n=1 Tax=Cellulomonas fulva TaxID=2835530 RepID=A0ABS5TX04_9CELL|nr:RNA polymerase subunit sigma-24 [Cellulomonas fulva]
MRRTRARGPVTPPDEVRAALDEAWRTSWSRVVALLVAQYRRPDLAEDAAADAFEAAARTWASSGVPHNPGAWLLTAARRRVLDRLRSEVVHRRKEPLMAVDDEMRALAAAAVDPGAHVADEQLRMVFACCHPAIAADDRVALTLRFVLGLPTAEIARLQLVQETAMAARITRAKKRLAASGIPFSTPDPQELAERLDVVATVVYLAFTSAYQPGVTGLRVDLGDEAIRLARTLDGLLPGQDVVRCLLALMMLQHSRRDTRLDDDGAIVLLPDQDRSRWHHDEIRQAVALLGTAPPQAATRLAAEYRLQALVAAEHATAPTAEATRWPVICDLYLELELLTGSPVVRLARAVAVAEADGPRAGLALLDGLDDALPRHHRVPAVRAELLARAGDPAAAATAYDRAIDLATAPAELAHLRARRATLRR